MYRNAAINSLNKCFNHIRHCQSRNSLRLLSSSTRYYDSSKSPPPVHNPHKLVIFDKDGTLTCLHSMWSTWCEMTADAFEKHSGHSLSDDIYDFLAYDKNTRKILKGNLAEKTQLDLKIGLAEILNKDYGFSQERAEKIVEICYPDTFEIGSTTTVKALDDIPSIFNELKENDIKIAVCTSDSRKGTTSALKQLGVFNMVDRLICGDDLDSVDKPAPDNVHLLCRELNVKPHETAIIGDTPMDTKMGRRSNCRSVIGVLTGVCDYHDLAPESDFIVESLSEALPLFLDTHQHSSSFYASKKPSLLHKENSKKTFTQTRSYSTVNIGTVERKEFTHVIVGAGSAGCTLANRLTEDANNSVLLLEAGPRDTVLNTKRLLWTIHMPAALMYNLCHDKYNWYYNTIPQKHMDNRSMYWPRGRVWGGSSSLNAMVYIRGHAEDYNRWHREGATGWDYDHCLPYFKKAQNHQLGGDTYRGGNGPLHVSQGDVSHPLHAAFLKGGQQAGYPYTSDMNGYQQEGVGPMDMTIHRGLRWNTASAYLRPALNRDNLTTEVNCLTTKVLFDGKKAIGVEVLNRGKLGEFYASNEVILSGGAINSPQLLMISGVGNADDLRPLGITVAHHLPGVGQNLQDHLELYVQHKCKKPITLYNDQQPVQMLKVGVEWMLQQTGQAATAHLHTGGFIRSEAGMPHPDVQYHFLPSQVIDHGRIAPEFHGYQAHVGTLRETSRGSMKLKSRSPYEHPILDPNYLATKEDVVALRNSVKLTREIFQQKAFDEFRGDEVLPGPSIQTDSEIDAFVRQNCQTAYHPSCTCKMGHEDDPMAVVDNETKVIGMENLRIVDSSIMPSIISGNLNAPTIMIAERAADIIRGRELLYMPNTPVYKPENQSSQR